MNKPQKETLFGHPVGLYTLFFAEMWERFSYYGMRALLVLYMTKGFLTCSDAEAYKIYGAYTALVYMTPFVGGMLADRFLGARRCVVLGGLLMAAGHLTMMVEMTPVFYLALALIVVGNGFFKPNISTMVGTLYGDKDPRREGGFTIFYMGINLGAAMAPLLCGFVGEVYGWHYGFGLATVGMLTGLAVFVVPNIVARVLILGGALTTGCGMIFLQVRPDNYILLAVNGFVAIALIISGAVACTALGRAGIPDHVGRPPNPKRLQERIGGFLPKSWLVYIGTALFVPVILVLIASNRTMTLIPKVWLDDLAANGPVQKVFATLIDKLSTPTGLIITLAGVVGLTYMIIEAVRATKIERDRLFVALIMMFFALLFFAFFEQAGSSLTNYTDRNVDRVLGGRVITKSDVGTTMELEVNQEQLGYANGTKMWNLTELDNARDEDATKVKWTVDSDDVGMRIEGTEIPTSTFQSVNPIFILVFGLPLTLVWGLLARARLEPSTTTKFALGLLQLGLGFGVVWYASNHCDDRGMVGLHWLFLCYLLHTTGELCLSPVGLSMITRLSPARLVSTMMGGWFLATGFSSYLASVIAAFTEIGEGEGEQVIPVPLETVNIYGDVYGKIAIAAIISSVICFLLVPVLNSWMHEEERADDDA